MVNKNREKMTNTRVLRRSIIITTEQTESRPEVASSGLLIILQSASFVIILQITFILRNISVFSLVYFLTNKFSLIPSFIFIRNRNNDSFCFKFPFEKFS